MDKYGGLCYSVAYSVLKSDEDAEECVNDAYLRVWDSIPPNRPDNFKAYVSKLVRNLSVDRLRAMTRKKRAADVRDVALSELEACLPSAGEPDEALNERELAERISALLTELESESRMLFVGRYWSYMTVDELAREFGFSKSKVKSSLFRTRVFLKERLEKEGYYI